MGALQIDVPYVKKQVSLVVNAKEAREIQNATIALRKAFKLESLAEGKQEEHLMEPNEFIDWIRQASGIQTDKEFRSTQMIAELIYQSFAYYSVNTVDLQIGTLAILDGSTEEKLQTALKLTCPEYPTLTEGSVVRCLTGVLMALYGLFANGSDDSNDSGNVVELMQFSAAQTVAEIMEHQPKLTFDSLWDWYLLMGGTHAPYLKLLDMTYWLQQEVLSHAASHNDAAQSPLVFTLAHNNQSMQIGQHHGMELEELLIASRFTVLQPQVMYDTFLQHTIDGWLDEATFEESLNELTSMTCTNHLLEDEKFMACMRQLFRNYLLPDATKVEAFELAAGFSLFCLGSKSDKLAAGFHYFDTDDAGFLNNDQLWRFLRSVVVTILGLVPVPESILLFVEDGAVEIMQDLEEPKYTFEQFGQWYNDGGFQTMSWLELLDLKKWVFVWPDFNLAVLDNEPVQPLSTSMYYTNKNIRATNRDGIDSDEPLSLTFESKATGMHLDSIPPLCLKNDIVLEFELPMDSEQVIRSLTYDNGDLMHYMRMQEATQLQSVSIRQAYECFQPYFSDEGVASLEKTDFDEIVASLMPHLTAAPQRRHTKQSLAEAFEQADTPKHNRPSNDALETLSSLYFAYNRVGTGKIDATEFLSGFLLLCAGSKSEKLSFCFGLFDEDNDGYLTRREMWKFLRSFLTMLLSLGNGADISAENLGMVCDAACICIARSIFNDTSASADTPPFHAKVSFEEFASWYSQRGYCIIPWIELLDTKKWPLVDPSIAQAIEANQQTKTFHAATETTIDSTYPSTNVIDTKTATATAFEFKLTTYDQTTLRIRLRDVAVVYTISEKLRLKSLSVDGLFEILEPFAKGKTLTKSGFLYAIRHLAPKDALSSSDQEFLSYHLLRMFSLYETESATDEEDENTQGVAVDKLHLVSGLSLFCHGSKSIKLGALFNLFSGAERSQTVARRALFEMLKSIVTMLVSFSLFEATSAQAAYAAERAAGALVSQVFCDTKSNASISLATFASWYSSGGHTLCPWLELLDLNKWPIQDALDASSREKPLAYAFDMHEEGSLLNYSEQDIDRYLTMLESTHFSEIPVHVLHDAILHAAKPHIHDGEDEGLVVSRSSFYSCIRKLVPRDHISEEGQKLASRLLARLFTAFDRKKTGKVNVVELACGLSIVGQGTKSQKLSTAFDFILNLNRKEALPGAKMPHAMLFLYLRSFLIALMVLSDTRYRQGIEQMYVEADDVVTDATTRILQDVTMETHMSLRSRNQISFEQFGEWYNSGGYETLSWVELLDVAKWQHHAPAAVDNDALGGVRASDIGLGDCTAVLTFVVANNAIDLNYTQTHLDSLRECLEHVELHLYTPAQLIIVIKNFLKRRHDPTSDLLSPTVQVDLTKEQCQRAIFQLCPRHGHCTNRYVASFVDHLFAVLENPKTHKAPLVQILCALMAFTDGTLLDIVIHGTALVCYTSFTEQLIDDETQQHLVPWEALRTCLEIFLKALYACSHAFERVGADGIAMCAKVGVEESLSFFADVYTEDKSQVACETFNEWFEAEGVKSIPWLGLVVLENWPHSLHLDLNNRQRKTHNL